MVLAADDQLLAARDGRDADVVVVVAGLPVEAMRHGAGRDRERDAVAAIGRLLQADLERARHVAVRRVDDPLRVDRIATAHEHAQRACGVVELLDRIGVHAGMDRDLELARVRDEALQVLQRMKLGLIREPDRLAVADRGRTVDELAGDPRAARGGDLVGEILRGAAAGGWNR